MKRQTIYGHSFLFDCNIEERIEDNCYILKSDESSTIEVELPEAIELFWPNREGELLKVDNIPAVLDSYHLNEASICYPATASMKLFILFDEEKNDGTVIYSDADLSGRIALLSLVRKSSKLFLKIESSHSEFKILNFKGHSFEDIVSQFIKGSHYSTTLEERINISKYQVQVGFISPFNKSEVDEDMGFDVCMKISELMNEYIGENNILHIFAYHAAHDSNYPQYFPSEKLGGEEKMKHAINEIHKNKQRCSLYMNARLFSSDLIDDFSYLRDSIVRDADDNFVVETYYERDFYVMDPNSAEWRELLLNRAKYLKTLGADIIQLDQVAGRAAIGEIGYSWGEGYRKLISCMQSAGLEIWIQGINEIYPANRFELCFRYPNILQDGTIRGGQPFGESYPLIPKLLNAQNFIIPIASHSLIDDIDDQLITVDLENTPGELSLYSPKYLKNLIKNLKEQSNHVEE